MVDVRQRIKKLRIFFYIIRLLASELVRMKNLYEKNIYTRMFNRKKRSIILFFCCSPKKERIIFLFNNTNFQFFATVTSSSMLASSTSVGSLIGTSSLGWHLGKRPRGDAPPFEWEKKKGEESSWTQLQLQFCPRNIFAPSSTWVRIYISQR